MIVFKYIVRLNNDNPKDSLKVTMIVFQYSNNDIY